MAMFQLGKLKFRFKDGGVDYRWGDGEAKRLGRKDPGMPDDYADEYSDYDEELNYDGRFADDQDYDQDDYPEDDYYEDDQYDDGYDNEPYEDNYADEPYDEPYDDESYADEPYYYDGDEDDYADDPYEDEYADDYDDRYSDEDADGGYGYADDYEDGHYDEGYASGMDGFIQYVDENDWVTYLLLVLLPPLGIYLLWRRQRFEPVVRYAVSAASAVWFVVMIVLLFTMLLRSTDVPSNHSVPTLAPSATASTTATAKPSASPSVTPAGTIQGGLSLGPSATPIGGGTASMAPDNIVWAPATGNLYHKNNACTLASGMSLAQTTVENAKNRGMDACPTCYGGTLYYATAGGDFYHLDKTCNDMEDAEFYTKALAEEEKKPPCPVCVLKTQKTLAPKVPSNLKFITNSTRDKSGLKVWCTSGGDNYHLTSTCRRMKGASQVTLKEALVMGKTACDTCCKSSGELVWCTKNGDDYHRDNDCRGMKDAVQVTVAEALVLGKDECKTCRPVANSSSSNSNNKKDEDTSSKNDTDNKKDDKDEYYVYATAKGDYYHLKDDCTGMKGAKKVTLKSMVAEGRPPCPTCCGGAGMSVYASKGGTYYHSYATCTGMTNATKGSLSNALIEGYKRCPRCWDSNTQSGSGSSADTATGDSVMVYCTQKGTWYHTKSDCTGMKGASRVTLTSAMNAGKTACPTCAATAQKTVYSTSKGQYYHKGRTCDNMSGASKRTLAEALKLGQTACPICMGGEKTESTNAPEKVANFSVGKSGIKVYASPKQKYFHTKSDCSGATGLSQVALETALNYGRKPCTKCAETASEKVYATKNGKYYHLSRTCAGSGAAKGSLAEALAYGFSPCPYCVTGSKTEPDNNAKFESGRSGIKVYAKADGTYYHAKQSCAGSGAVKVTLETALNYGKRACGDCCAVADRTVYAVKGTFYYHANKSCAGDGATKGNYAQALAYGLTACPNCIGGSGNGGSAPTEGPEYTAPAESSVYVDLYSDSFYYHRSSSCSGAGMKDGTEVTLEYAKDFGYNRCTYCNPASSIE